MLLDKYTTFEEVLQFINDTSEVKLRIVHHAEGRHIAMAFEDKPLPISINESEFNFMHDIIVKHNLRSGFELSTGTGVSTIAIGSGFKKTGGNLISMDSYFEEIHTISDHIEVGHYSKEQKEDIEKKAYGIKVVKAASKALELENSVSLRVGWSPTDSVMDLAARGTPVDFVFFDCPKSDEDFKRDFEAILPFLAHKYVIFLHDSQCFSQATNDLIRGHVGLELQKISEYPEYEGKASCWKRFFPLAMINSL